MLKVWVLVYDHRHGKDVSAYRTEAAAEEAAAEIIREYLDEIDECGQRKQICQWLQEEKLGQAIHEYNEWHLSEWIDILECELHE